MGVTNARITEVENRRRKNGAGVTLCYAFDKVIEIANAATRDDGNVDRIGNCAREFEVIAVARAVAVH